ncbi:helix-turn-helix domain-containing protein [Nocardia sp. BSTN01]|uniref:helix-turn-helix domain-containing protein n=1 Tax=Nocardia sp. BSTN01 TaxID=2783665 RepID=UPI00188F31EF|nr:helix-turn-helix domain-containing protein [Nocardia sp. BSTN01]MBF4998640.1 helix-turn-helix domain-containing protein [Nocardia sp. BSTN01]
MAKQTVVTAPEYTDLQGAATILSCDERTIRRLIADGKLKAYKLGTKAVRIRLTDLGAVLRPFGGGVA